MYKTPETQADQALGTLWNWTWPLLFVSGLTILSMATQKYSGYVEPHPTVAHVAPASPAPAQ